MATVNNIDILMSDLDISNEEDEELVLDVESEQAENRFELCLVGKFLTEKNLNVRAMKSKMADIWKPAMGINIKVLTPSLFLFQFYHKDDMIWMMNNGPWSFDNALLVTNTIPVGVDPTKVALNTVEFWIQIYDLPSGYMSESVGKQLGNFFGSFLSYDLRNNTSIWREYMRIRIKVDVRLPLKRKKKICKKDKSDFIVNCKYEKLGDFCFVCGMLTHTERFCKKKIGGEVEGNNREWGPWLRAPPRRQAGQERSKWLREEGDVNWGKKIGKDNNQGFQNHMSAKNAGFQQEVDNAAVMRERNKGIIIQEVNFADGSEGIPFSTNSGPMDKELDGLDIEERKRKRVGPNESMDVVGGSSTAKSDSGLSTVDCTDSSPLLMATLAKQASQFQ